MKRLKAEKQMKSCNGDGSMETEPTQRRKCWRIYLKTKIYYLERNSLFSFICFSIQASMDHLPLTVTFCWVLPYNSSHLVCFTNTFPFLCPPSAPLFWIFSPLLLSLFLLIPSLILYSSPSLKFNSKRHQLHFQYCSGSNKHVYFIRVTL